MISGVHCVWGGWVWGCGCACVGVWVCVCACMWVGVRVWCGCACGCVGVRVCGWVCVGGCVCVCVPACLRVRLCSVYHLTTPYSLPFRPQGRGPTKLSNQPSLSNACPRTLSTVVIGFQQTLSTVLAQVPTAQRRYHTCVSPHTLLHSAVYTHTHLHTYLQYAHMYTHICTHVHTRACTLLVHSAMCQFFLPHRPQVVITKTLPPSFSFGVRHSQYLSTISEPISASCH